MKKREKREHFHFSVELLRLPKLSSQASTSSSAEIECVIVSAILTPSSYSSPHPPFDLPSLAVSTVLLILSTFSESARSRSPSFSSSFSCEPLFYLLFLSAYTRFWIQLSMAASSLVSPLCSGLLSACMSVNCGRNHSFDSSMFSSSKIIETCAGRRKFKSKCSSRSSQSHGTEILSSCGSKMMQGLTSSCILFKPQSRNWNCLPKRRAAHSGINASLRIKVVFSIEVLAVQFIIILF